MYEKETGRLREITYGSDQNGAIDTWIYMDGMRVLCVKIDHGEDGTVDRWEYYDEAQQLEKVGFSHGAMTAWWMRGRTRARMHRSRKLKFPPCVTARLIAGVLREQRHVRAEEDASGDGRVDKWRPMPTERSPRAAFDEDGDGRPGIDG